MRGGGVACPPRCAITPSWCGAPHDEHETSLSPSPGILNPQGRVSQNPCPSKCRRWEGKSVSRALTTHLPE